MKKTEPIVDSHEGPLNRVADFVDGHIKDDFTIAQLAKLAGFSASYFRNVFTEWAGETPSDYVLHRRLDISGSLLIYMADLPIGDIGRRCGFRSVESFGRAFRQHFRMTPSEWRAGGYIRWDALLNPQPIVPHPLWDVRVEEIPQVTTLYLRKIGSYYENDAELWLRLWKLVLQLGLGKPQLFGAGLDNPAVTPPARCRYDVCAAIPDDLALPEGVSSKYMSGGLYALLHFEGAKIHMEGHWRWLLYDWLPHSDYRYGLGACYERHLIYPTELDMVKVELCVPLERK